MRLCLYISIDLFIYGPIHVSIYLRITFSIRPSIYLSKDLLACKPSAASVSFVLDVSRFNSTLSSPRPSWSASVGHCLHLSRTGLTTATTKAPTTGKRLQTRNLQHQDVSKMSTNDALHNCAVRAAGALFEPSTRKSFNGYAVNFLEASKDEILLTYSYRKIFCVQSGRNFAYLLLPKNFWSPVKAEILLTYCFRKIFGAQ